MGVFGNRTTGQTTTGYSVINDRLVIRGELDTDGTVRVDGRVEGTAHRVGSLIVGVGGTVIGNVDAREVVVAGTIQGNVHASGRLEIEKGASVFGEIRAASMVLNEGATFQGQLSIGVPPTPAVAVPAASVARRLEIAPALPPTTGRARG